MPSNGLAPKQKLWFLWGWERKNGSVTRNLQSCFMSYSCPGSLLGLLPLPSVLCVFTLNSYSSVNKAKLVFLPESNQISSNWKVLICYLVYGASTGMSFRLLFSLLPSRVTHQTGALVFFPWMQSPAPWASGGHVEVPTLPRPGVSFTLLTALNRQGGAGGGDVCRMPLKLVAKRGGSATEEVEGRCFFFLEDRFNFWAALEGRNAENEQ